MSKGTGAKIVFISKIWKLGETLCLGIPKQQNPLFKGLRGKSLKVTVEEINNGK